MPEITFNALRQWPMVADFQRVFHETTGLPLALLPSGQPDAIGESASHTNAFCALIANRVDACKKCLKTISSSTHTHTHVTADKPNRQLVRCFARLNSVAVPVVVENRPVAIFVAGPVLTEKPTRRDFTKAARCLCQTPSGELPRLQQAWMRSRVMPKEKLLAAADLVTFFAKYVATVAEREGPVLPNDCPQCVARAREFVNAHLNETIKMRAVADHVHLCPQHFCKKFRNATGITFTEYVSRLRVDKAKKLLLDNGNRVSEVAFECGFGSIPQFYRAFHRHTRVSPSAYRASFRQTLVGEKTKRKS